MSFSKLYFLVGLLSVVVLLQATFIISKLSIPEVTTPGPELPQELVTELEEESLKQAKEFLQQSKTAGQASLELVKTADNEQVIDIYLTSSDPVVSLEIILNYDPQAIKIIDQDKTRPQIQIKLEQLSSYFVNKVDSKLGTIELGADFETAQTGKIKLASFQFSKLDKTSAQIDFDFVKNSQATSYVLDDQGENILDQVKGLEL